MENQELRDVFLAEAVEIKDALDRILTTLERQSDKPAPLLAEAFRLLHTLKGNATAMGITGLANLAHALEDILVILQQKPALLSAEVIGELFRANDKLNESLLAWKEGKQNALRGFLARLEVLTRQLQEGENALPAQTNGEAEPETPAEMPPVQNIIGVSETINVATHKLDYLLDLVGELSIENDRLLNTIGLSSKELGRLQRLTEELHHAVLHTRLVQVQDIWQKFHRLVRDTAQAEQKQVELVLEGSETEIDRKILPVLAESLVHLIRNAISHGIESPEERRKAEKNAVGKLYLRASGYRDRVRIEVQDDGKGILPTQIREAAVRKGLLTFENAQKLSDEQALQTIFLTGFSSAATVSEISGRGIGLDVVKKSVEAIGGEISIETVAGKGTTFALELPSSIALKPVLLFEAEHITWAIPIDYVMDIVAYRASDVHQLGNTFWIKKGDLSFPLLVPAQVLKRMPAQAYLAQLPPHLPLLTIRLREKGQEFGILANKLLQQKEIFEKPLPPPLHALKLISGASILGDGRVALTLDVRQWLDFFFHKNTFTPIIMNNPQTPRMAHFEQALQASANALSAWLGELVRVENIENRLPALLDSSYIFATEVRGDWAATSWLACTKPQMETLWASRHASDKQEGTHLLQIALLSELDNIVCAHFATHVDTAQGTSAFGDAPYHFLWHKSRALPAHECILSCLLTTSSTSLQFIWFV